jgi:hypothetical protein
MQAPPEEAKNACVNRTENNSCTFQTPQGIIEGTCRNIQNELACVPE